MPAAYARTSTQALTNSTLPYALKLANLGLEAATKQWPELSLGLNTYRGDVVHQKVGEAAVGPIVGTRLTARHFSL